MIGFVVLGYALHWASRRQQSRVSPAEISQIRSRVSADLDPRPQRRLQQKEQPGSLATCRTGHSG
jgi:hypothetical protein